jgi:hypothetical protein
MGLLKGIEKNNPTCQCKKPSDLKESQLLGLDKPRPAVWLPEPQTGIGSELPLGRESQPRFSSKELEGKELQCHLAWRKNKR